MARRLTPPFRADHVGSLLRPPALLRARADHAAGTITEGELRAAEDEAIAGAVRMQEEIGLQSATDGEFRRAEAAARFVDGDQLCLSPSAASPRPSTATPSPSTRSAPSST
jgi:5-methyltetrahydropteroyltriglutamate--homocysteine methyltransferase